MSMGLEGAMAVRSTRTGLATLASGELEYRQDILSGRVNMKY